MLATPEPIKDWSLASLKEKMIKLGAGLATYGQCFTFEMIEALCRGRCSPRSWGSSPNGGRANQRWSEWTG